MLRGYFFFVWFFLKGFFSLHGQALFISENQIFSVSTDALVCVEGAMTNEGIVANQGVMQVSGDWTNRQSYAGEGTVELVGATAQTIQHHEQSFGVLQINGDGRKQLESPIWVANRLVLTQGLVESSSENVLRLTPEATVEGGDASSYVLGPVVCSGTGYRFFPIGTETEFLPVVLEDVQGVNPSIRVQAISPHPDPIAGEGLEWVSDQQYWSLEVEEGSFDGSLVTLPVDADDNFTDLFGVVAVQAAQVGGPFTNLGQSARHGTDNEGTVTSRLPVTQSILALGLTTEFSVENKIEIPSAFAPQASNPEDRALKVYAANLLPANFSFTIFNRWGQVVYQTEVLYEALTDGWNGLHFQTGEPLPVGVYHYVLRGMFETNRSIEKTGAITLFR